MFFNSMAFFAFLIITFILYWKLPAKYRWIIILAANCYFYMSWNAAYLLLLFFTTLISYVAALLIEKYEQPKVRKGILSIAAILCLGILFFFKYFNFVSTSVTAFLQRFALELHPVTLNLLLPVGISFYTFQTLGYIIDVYRGTIKAERHFGIYAAFVSFFPSITSGPIARGKNLLPQLRSEGHFKEDTALYGLKTILWGFFKKYVIADMLAAYVDVAYNATENYTGFVWILVSFFFTLQIYCDFSGYSDIAIGVAKLFNIDLLDNFKSPYFSTSVKEFWRRWHISLSSWLRDYVYISLGGNRCSKFRRSMNLFVTFLVSGLWHGANWTYIIWGAIHGLAQVLENTLDGILKGFRRQRLGKIISTICVFLFSNFAWIFFRADSFRDAVHVITHMFTGIRNLPSYFEYGLIQLELNDPARLLYIGVLLLILTVYDYYNKEKDVILMLNKQKPLFQWIFYLALGLFVVFFSQKGVSAEFVYFQF